MNEVISSVSTQEKPGDTPNLSEQWANLWSCYTLITESSLIMDVLAEVPAIYSLPNEAVQPLQRAFGAKKLLQLEALESHEDKVLRVMVKLSPDAAKPAELMSKFKLNWWLANCSRSKASLVFDYQIVNGF